jgi:hypothetical protein
LTKRELIDLGLMSFEEKAEIKKGLNKQQGWDKVFVVLKDKRIEYLEK